MSWRARDVMQTVVQSVDPETALPDLERAFLTHGVSGFPVLSEGRLVGIVSRSDVVRQLCVERSVAEILSAYYTDLSRMDAGPVETFEQICERVGQRIEHLRVEDVMIHSLITVSPDQPLAEVARILLKHRIHRVPVTDGECLVGIVTSLDLVRLLAEERVKPA